MGSAGKLRLLWGHLAAEEVKSCLSTELLGRVRESGILYIQSSVFFQFFQGFLLPILKTRNEYNFDIRNNHYLLASVLV